MCYSQRNEFSTSLVDFVNLPDLNIIQFGTFYRGFAFLTGVYAKYLLQNRFAFLISLFDLSAILKIRNGEHAH